MGKRQTRILSSQITTQSALLVGKEANVTLHNQATFHGVIVEVTTDALKMKDMRLKKHTFPLHQIAEVVLDAVAEW